MSKFRCRILHNLINIIKLWKNQSVKVNFELTTRATLRDLREFRNLTQQIPQTSFIFIYSAYSKCYHFFSNNISIKNQRKPGQNLKSGLHYPFKWIQLIEWSNYLNMNSCLHLSNKLKECGKFLWIHLWNLCIISMKEFIFGKTAGCQHETLLNWTPA